MKQHLSYSIKRNSGSWLRMATLSVILLAGIHQRSDAQIHPLISCSISGTTPVYVGQTYTYTLGGGCSIPQGDSWSVTCGSIQSQTSTTVTVYFNQTGCSSSTITATGTSAQAKVVTVNTPPAIVPGTISPASQSINYNTVPGLMTLSGVSGGIGGFTYLWQSSANSSFTSPTNITGATSTTYTPPALTATTYYRVLVTSGLYSAYSAIATVTVYPQIAPGTITPGSQSIFYGTVPASMSISTSSGGNGTYTYQWQSSPNNSSWTNISGATTTSYAPPALTTTTYYHVVVTSNSASANSASVEVQVGPPLAAGTTTPTNQLTNAYTESPPYNLTTTAATGGACNGCYTYQWQQLLGSTWTNISGAAGPSFNPGPGQPTATSYYRVAVSDGTNMAYSAADTISYQSCVIGGPTECWVGQTTSYYYYYGSPLSSYVWNPAVGATIIGASTGVATLNVQWTQAGLAQPVNLSYGTTGNMTYLTLYVNVRSLPLSPGVIGMPWQNVEQSSVNGLDPSPAYGGSCNGVFSFQWQQSTDSVDYTNVSGQTGNSLNETITGKIWYRRQVTCGSSTAYTDTAEFTTYPYFNPGTISLGTTDSTAWNTIPLPVSGTYPTGGIDSIYTYQWFYSTNGSNYYPIIDGGQGVNYQPPALATSTDYYRQATCGPTTRNSNIVQVAVQTVVFNPGVISPYTSVVSSGSSPTLTGTAANGGTSATYTYQWQQSYDEISWTNISGATSTSYTPPSMSRTTYFRRFVTNNAQSGLATVPGYFNDVKVKVDQALGALVTPNGSTGSTAGSGITAIPVNSYTYPGLTAAMMNSIVAIDVEKPGVTTLSAAEALTSQYDYRQNTTYFDDYGREIQTVAKQVTPDNNDLISVMNYDELGRTAQKYLSYYDSSGTGSFRTNATTKQPAFYNNFFNNLEGFYYSNTIYDGSALNRVVKETQPGNSWTGNNIGPRMDYTFNTSMDSVQIWKIGNNLTDTPTVSGVYAPGALALLITTDENENKVMEYKDMEGKLILKKVQLNDTLYDGYYGWLSTYYVYDYFNNLRYVLSPKAVQYAWSNSWVLNSIVRNELCFQYNYDSLGRMITKIIPGAGMVNMVYDARNRLVMSQDSMQRYNGNWIVTGYDSMDRKIITSLWANSNTRSYFQSAAGISTNYPTLSGTYSTLTEDYYDDYTWETRSYININQQFTTNFNDNTDLPVIWSNAYSLTPALTAHTRGMSTGARTNVLNTTQYLYSASFFDDYNRIVQVQSNNITNAWDTLTTRYDFSGHVLSTCQTKAISTPDGTIKWNKIVTAFNYDQAGRVLNTNKYLNGATTFETLNTNTYDKLGRLGTKSLGSKPVETQTYNYTIRGWLKGINRNYANNGSGGNWFGLDLSYDYGFNASQTNGNIAGEVWTSRGDPVSRAYGFIYDNTNRLLTGDYTQNDGSGYIKDAQVDFNVDSLTYDANGNILLMQQKGVQINSSTVIDHLAYSYLQAGQWSNKLANVVDNSGNTAPLGDYQQGTNSGNDFFYDGNGNMLVDSNKKIYGIVYNILNLPQTVPMRGKGTISYIYDADGNKLEKLVVDSTFSQTNPLKDTTLYSGNLVYNNDSLQFIGHEEGRIRPKLISPTGGWVTSNIEYVYDYFVKDHLGNTRMVLSEETEQDSYVATMEQQNATLENELFDSVASTQYPKPAGFDSDTANHYVSMLDASSSGGTRIGPMIILKVMAGDTITASTYCWYNTPVQSPTGPSLLTSLVPALASGSVAVSSERLLAEQPSIDNILTSNLPTFLSYKDGQYVNTSPKAFLNWALFDDRFNYVTGGVTQVPVIASGNPSVAITANTPVSIPKNGYIYIYVSNESPQPVYFDNVSIQDHRGPLLEENHYYPFGLTMAGISDLALKTQYAQNKFRYNGKELQNQEYSDGTGLQQYDYSARMLDPQLGRWWVQDPLSVQHANLSNYVYTNNNPISYTDPDGKDFEKIHGGFSSVVIDPSGKVTQINLDGDPGVYMDAGGPLSLVGFMDPNVTYHIGGGYKYYNKKDYYEKHPVTYVFPIGKCEICDPNYDQNNIVSAGQEVMGTTLLTILTDGVGEGAEVAATAEKGISVIGPREVYREFAKKIGAHFLDIADKDWSWTKNLEFLKGIVSRGDDVVFAGKFDPAKLTEGTPLAEEIKYLAEHGYKWTTDFTKMVKK
jgi:RHS repeat-associated protein